MTGVDEMTPSRRGVLIGGAVGAGGLLVGNAIGVAAKEGDVKEAVNLNAFVVIHPDSRVQIMVGRAEMGQGIHSAMAQLVAEELEADWSDIEVVHAPADGVYGMTSMIVQALPFGDSDPSGTLAHLRRKLGRFVGRQLPLQMTGGSNSIRDGWRHMREVGAAARHMLLQAAASKWSVPVDQCKAIATQIIHEPTGRVLRYGEVAAKAARLSPPSNPKLKDPSAFTLVGKGVTRPDLPSKVNGSAVFGIDVREEGQLYATLKQCPIWGGTLKSFDDSVAKDVPGFVKAVPVTDGVAAIATNTWAAKQALDAIEIVWDAQGNDTRNSDALHSAYQEQLGAAGDDAADSHVDEGDAADVIAAAARTMTADYAVPFLAHAPMEPMNTTALVKDGTCTLWTPTQSQGFAVQKAAEAAGVEESQVTVHTTMMGGGFGRRGEIDYIVRAVEVARAMPGTPIQTMWSREEDMRRSAYRPKMLARMTAALDEDGKPLAWAQRNVGQAQMMEFMARNAPFAPPGNKDGSAGEGITHMNYNVGALSMDHVRMRSPIWSGFWRSVGHSHNAFFKEGFVDELAHEAGVDPYQYRRALLKDKPRALAVLDKVADMAGWNAPLRKDRARGIAFHESFGSFVGEVAEVSHGEDGLQVHKVWVAVDCGHVVNPDTVKAQMMSGVIFGLSAALFGEITFEDGEVVQQNFPDYEMVRLHNAPDVAVEIIPSTEYPGGVGEPSTPPIAPAVTNALFALTGQRIPTLPLMNSVDIV